MGGTPHGFCSRLGVTALTIALSGCVAQHDDTLRLHEELGRARGEAVWQQAHAAQLEARAALLESRLSRLEERSDTGATRPVEDSRLLGRLERILELNERLLAELAAPSAVGVAPASDAKAASRAPATKTAAVAGAAASDALTLSQQQLLQVLIESILARPGSGARGGLTRDQENALRLLMRPERKLDTENPWSETLY
jgi:hypothetical protein